MSVQPAAGNYDFGDIITTEVWVENVVDLYGADVRLGFDPTRLQVLDDNLARPGVQISPRSDLLSPDLVLINSADNTNGEVAYVAVQLNPCPPASGSGALFQLRLQVVGSGQTEVSIGEQLLTTKDADPIHAEIEDAYFTLGCIVVIPLIFK
ncbi:MAG: hypothetical protein JXA78_14785 [Anaerolineales bacterium]|nr:hypothetical protein [Anaerolineales bacterium]